jgi:hypothetical protein
MRSPRLLVCIALGLFFSTSAFAQQSTSTTLPTTSDPQAVGLLQRSLAALTNGVQVADVTLDGSARRIAGSDDESGTATLEATSAGDSRMDLSLSGSTWTEIRNHSAMPLPGGLPPGAPASAAEIPQPVGEWIGSDGAPHSMAAHNVMTDPSWFFPALTIENLLSSQNFVLSYIGQETHDGLPVLHVSVWQQFPGSDGSSSADGTQSGTAVNPILQHLSQMDVYFDPNSLLPVALFFNAHPDNNGAIDIGTEIRFSDYQSVSGIAVPMHVQKYVNNSLALDFQLTNTTLNSGLPASAFAIE